MATTKTRHPVAGRGGGKTAAAKAAADPMAAYAQAAKPGDNILAQIAETARQQLAAEAKVAEAEAALKLAQEELRLIAEGAFVSLMENAQQKELTTLDGYPVRLVDDLKGALPKGDKPESLAKRRRGIAFVLKHEPSIIRHQLAVDLGKPPASKEEADLFNSKISQVGKTLRDLGWDPKVGLDIHHSTLKAFAREVLTEGKVEVPLEDLGLQVYKRVEVKRPE